VQPAVTLFGAPAGGSSDLHSVTILPGDRHRVSFAREAIELGRALDYVSGDRVLLHVVVREAFGALVVNDRTGAVWNRELSLPLSAADLAAPILIELCFEAAGVILRLPDGRSARFERWVCPAEAVELRCPPAITLELPERLAVAPTARAMPPQPQFVPMPKTQEAPAAPQAAPHAGATASAQGRSMAEVGALAPGGGVLLASALADGAASVTAIDLAPLDHAGWDALLQRLLAGGAARQRIRLQMAGLTDSYFPEQVGTFDLVSCRGLLHRLPDPFTALLHLRLVTRLRCEVAVPVLPPIFANVAGRQELINCGAIFVPTLIAPAKAILAAHLAALGPAAASLLSADAAPWVAGAELNLGQPWWLMTAAHVESLAVLAGFRVASSGLESDGITHRMLLDVP